MPEEVCKTVRREVEKVLPVEECAEVPKKKCRQVKSEVPRRVPHFSPTTICQIPKGNKQMVNIYGNGGGRRPKAQFDGYDFEF